MPLDTSHHVIYICSRKPSKLVLSDIESLTIISENNITARKYVGNNAQVTEYLIKSRLK